MLDIADLLQPRLLQEVGLEDHHVGDGGPEDASFVVFDVFSQLVVAESEAL